MPTVTANTAFRRTIIATVCGRARRKSGCAARIATDPNTVPEKSVSTWSAKRAKNGRRW
jgi:hypothetical protein